MTKSSTALKVAEGVGAGLAVAAAAAAAGYYFYGSTKAKQHRKIVAKWADDMKDDVVRESRRLKSVGPEVISTIVDAVAKTYRDIKNISSEELKQASTELKSNWKKIQSEVGKTKKRIAKSTKKVADPAGNAT